MAEGIVQQTKYARIQERVSKTLARKWRNPLYILPSTLKGSSSNNISDVSFRPRETCNTSGNLRKKTCWWLLDPYAFLKS